MADKAQENEALKVLGQELQELSGLAKEYLTDDERILLIEAIRTINLNIFNDFNRDDAHSKAHKEKILAALGLLVKAGWYVNDHTGSMESKKVLESASPKTRSRIAKLLE